MKKYKNVLWILIAIICVILQSPKVLFPLAAWIAPVFLLLLSRQNRFLKGHLLILLALIISGIIGQYNVMPYPMVAIIISTIFMSIINLLPFIADKFFFNSKKAFWRTFIFPAAYMLLEYYNANSPAGIWFSISGTQATFLPLIQSASIVGIWGVVFFIYWFASVAVFVYEKWIEDNKKAVNAVIVFSIVFSVFLVFGLIRLTQKEDDKTVKVAAVTVDNSSIFETIYKSATGNEIQFGAETSPTAPEFMQINKSLIEFLMDSDNEKYEPVKAEMIRVYNEAFEKSKVAAHNGGEIILWSEGLGLVMLDGKSELINKGQEFAKENNVYLMLAYAAFFKGEPKAGEAIYENRVLTISPKGEILNTFDKNMPVPNVERSAPGDGTIPVIKTEFGNISPSICYDADFPDLIAQTGKNETELLLIPTNDWKAITPYHSYTTRYRAIENGISIIKSTGKGLSIAYDQYGRILEKSNFFDTDDTMIVDIPVGKVKTLFPTIGNYFAHFWMLFFVIVFIIHLAFLVRNNN